MNKPLVLLVDKDPIFLEAVKHAGPNVDIQSAYERKEAQLAIADKSMRFSAIGISNRVEPPFSLALVKFAKAHRPATPLYLLLDNTAAMPTRDQLHSLHIQECIPLPQDAAAIVNKLVPSFSFDLKSALSAAEKSVQMGQAITTEEKAMHPIDAYNFICGKNSFFDVYVKIGESKYLMILKAGDNLDPSRIAQYLQKGVVTFYIKNESHEHFLKYCETLTDAILRSEKTSIEIKQNQTQNLGKETFEHLKMVGLSESTLFAAQKFVNHSQTLVHRANLHKVDAVKSFLKNMILADHGTGTVIILSALLEALQFSDEKVVSTIALGGFLHDLGILSLPPEYHAIEHIDELTPEAQNIYKQHPLFGAEAIAKVPHISPLLPQVILQHHERRNKKGYPAGIGSGAISPVSELIGIADELNTNIRKMTKNPNLHPIEATASKFNDFSAQTVEGFRKAFLK